MVRYGWVAVLLSANAGYVDATGYVLLRHVHTAFMSGNTVDLGIRAHQAAACGVALVMFVVGLLVSRLLLHIGSRRKAPSARAWPLLLEWALLVAVVMFAGPLQGGFAVVAMLAVAMGLQNAALTHYGALTVYSSHVTGTLTKLAEELASAILGSKQGRLRPLGRAGFLVGVWSAYIVGAIAAAHAASASGLRALVPSAGLLVILIVLDFVWPVPPPAT